MPQGERRTDNYRSRREWGLMPRYYVSYMVVYGEEVEADSPEEAANIVANNCFYDVDGAAAVTNLDTDEQVEVY